MRNEDEVNRLLLGKDSSKRRVTGKVKALREFNLSRQEELKRSEDRISQKVWNVLTKDAQDALHRGDSTKIGVVKEDSINIGKPGGVGGYVLTVQE